MNRRPMLVLSTTLLLLCALACSAKTVYVKWDSPGPTFDGASWATACHKVQDGLNAAASGDEVWVAKGTYVECITLKDGVGLYGGFAGTEAERYQRDFRANETILDGNQIRSVVYSPPGVTETARIDGFTVRRGTGTTRGTHRTYGGGMLCDSSSPTIANNVITNNDGDYGGGICCLGSSPTIADNIIRENTGSLGAGIYCKNSASRISHNTIWRNRGTVDGAAVYVESSSATVTGNIISQNGWYDTDGAVYCLYGSPTISSNAITGNGCGGVYSEVSSAKITGNTITDNGQYALYCHFGSPTASNNIIAFNCIGVVGMSSSLVLRSNCVYGNSAHDHWGATAGTGDISMDPLFAGREYGNVHIQPSSPCRNTGWTNAPGASLDDIDSEPRVQDEHPDIGADESDGTSWSQGPYTIVRVSPAGSDSNDGSSWPLAKKTVQAGIDQASAIGGEVWVQAGTYNERIDLRPYAYVYGGFVGSEVSQSDRTLGASRTILDCGASASVITASAGQHASLIDGFTIRNGSSYYGGGINCHLCSPTITNCIITQNAASSGGGICLDNSSATITACTIACNSAAYAGGIYLGDSYCSPLISNNIVAFNSSGIAQDPNHWQSGRPVLRNNNLYNPDGPSYSDVRSGIGNISSDPLFSDRDYGDFHLRPGSPCINTGWNGAPGISAIDTDGQPRIQGETVDMGADESDGTIPATATRPIIRVSTSGDNANDGSAWWLAKKTVQAAIDTASASGGEVWVKEGVYNERIVLREYVYLYGGFAGAEANRTERDTTAHATVLDGGAGGTAVTATGPGYRLSTIDGFTIRNGQALYGGGVYSSGLMTISNNTICGNSSTHGGGVFCSGSCVIGNTISENTAAYGAGISCGGRTLVTNNKITGNSASSSGGGLYFSGGSGTAAQNLILMNVITGNSATNLGGGIYCAEDISSITNNTIVANSASSGGGIAYWFSPETQTSNNIIAFNSSGVNCTRDQYEGPPPPYLSNNCIFGNAAYDCSGMSSGGFSVLSDPLFVDRTNGNYHLTGSSPCINAGYRYAGNLPLFDMDGEGRTFGGKVDIGADEYWSPTMSESDAKRAADGARISGRDATVSAVFDGFFYVEADDRSSGIRIEKPDHGLHVGDRAEITGELKTSADGERYIEAPTAVANGTGMIPPLGLPNRSIGGAGWFYDAVSGSGQAGQKEYRPVYTEGSWINTLMDVPDLNNIGLLISTTGQVTYVGDVFFYLDDGSKLDDGSGHTGVKVALEGQAMPALDSYVKVTGVSSCYKLDGSLFRLVRATAITQISR